MENNDKNRNTVLEKVTVIVMDILGVEREEVNEGSDIMDDLGADSLDMVEIVMSHEKEFNIAISDRDAENIKTVKDVVDYLIKNVDDTN